ncbi:MAG: FCD domain-containing protein, partial [Pseudomonadota bacterium]
LGQVRGLLEADGFAPDGKLPTERALCVRFGVGRRALRKALDALEAEGLIWRRQGKGTFVGEPPDPRREVVAQIAHEADPVSVMEARLCMEPELAALSAQRASEEDIARMVVLAQRACRAEDAQSAELWDGSLHRVIARTAHNALLLTSFALLDEVRSKARWQDERIRARSPERRARYDEQHLSIVEAIKARHADAAREAMKRHLVDVMEGLQHVRIRERQ